MSGTISPTLHTVVAEQLLNVLQGRGVTFSVEAGGLRYQAPAGALTPDLLTALREHKPAVLALLAEAAYQLLYGQILDLSDRATAAAVAGDTAGHARLQAEGRALAARYWEARATWQALR